MLQGEFLLGLFSGVLSSILFEVLRRTIKFYYKFAIDQVSTDIAKQQLVNISGEWQSDKIHKGSFYYEETLNIVQNGMAINGTATYIEYGGPSGKPETKIFIIQGTYRERVLTISYQAKDKRSASSGCITALLKSDHVFKGYCVYYDYNESEVGDVTHDLYIWRRKPH